MSSELAGSDDTGAGRVQEFTVTDENTFAFLPGTQTGISCPSCFRDMLLKEVIHTGECNSCGADLELTLRANPDE